METKRQISIFFLFSTLIIMLAGCDSDRLKKCEWYLVPEKEHIDYVANGWVSICARNYVNKRQRCYLKMKIEDAERVYGKPVQFSSLDIGTGAIKEIKSYDLCTQSPEDAAIKK
jgi:hypothetical protein